MPESTEYSPQAEGAVTVPRKKSRVHKGEGLWLMSFSDMSLILMSFFVLQLAYSTPDKHKYDNLSTAIKEQQQTAKKDKDAKAVAVENLKTLSEKIRRLIKEKKIDDVATVSEDLMGLSIEFRDQLIFNPGSSELNPSAKQKAGVVLKAIASAPGEYRLIFEGHTDDEPVGRGRYNSNWELSSARGIALVNAFKAQGVSESRMTLHAYAQTRPKINPKGLSGEALLRARAINRRVVIRIE